MSKIWAIIGAGNGGQALAGHLALLAQKVRIFDVMPGTVHSINSKGGIFLEHALEGFGKLQFATDDMKNAMDGADIIIIVLPSQYHESISKQMIPHLRDGQVVLLHPEASCGAIAFRKQTDDMGCTARIVLAAASTLLYSCRLKAPGEIHVFGLKKEVLMAALPATDNHLLEEAICDVLPWFKVVPSVIVTSLSNPNAIMHPTPMLLNTARIEAVPFQPYEYYHEGITPTIGSFLERMHEERIDIALSFGISLRSIRAEYAAMYDCGDDSMPLYQLCRNNKAYEGIMMANTLKTRYLMEDIPYSLVATQSLARVVGVSTPCIDAVVCLAVNMLPGELDSGRTAEALGIDKMSKKELLQLVNG